MKRLLTSRILACLIFLTIWESKTYAQGSISSYTAGTETFEITSNTSIPKQSTEYQYYASANISLFIGADEVWENPKLIGGKYYLHSQGGPGILPDGSSNKNQKDAGYYEAKNTTGNSACIALPNTGNYFHFLFHTKGKIKLAFNVNYANPGNKYLYIEKPTKNNVTLTNKGNNNTTYTTKIGISSEKTQVSSIGTTITELQSGGDNRYFKINASAGDHSMDIVIDAEAGEEYYIWMYKAEEFALGGFTFEVDDSQRFTPWKPVVHRQIEYGRSPENMKDADANAPSGVEDITFMYGGWTNHPNAVKAATWDEVKKTWGFNDNGNENTKYTINGNEKTDNWEEVKAESETTEKLVTLDGYGKFTAGCGQVPTDQYGNAYTPTTSAAPSVANIPCRGTYYKFEPAKDGTLNVYVRQAANSPLFLVDETGKPQKSIDYKAGNDANFTEGNDASYTIDKLAACQYGFNVKAGKTYVLFQNNETLGFYGFTFGASSTEISNVTISQADGYAYEAKNNATVTLTKPLKANVWNAICLPFSMTEQQVRNAFGENARIAEFKKVDESGKKAVASFGMHYYQLITAGKPCLIKPSQVNENDTYTIKGVTIDAEKALTIADSNNLFNFVGTYARTTMPVNSHFLGSNDGKLYYITADKDISGLKAFFKPVSTSNAKLSIAFDNTDNDFDNNTTGIEAIKDYMDQDAANSSANKGIYNINGQFMGTNPAILPQGIYVKNGKKFIVK